MRARLLHLGLMLTFLGIACGPVNDPPGGDPGSAGAGGGKLGDPGGGAGGGKLGDPGGGAGGKLTDPGTGGKLGDPGSGAGGLANAGGAGASDDDEPATGGCTHHHRWGD